MSEKMGRNDPCSCGSGKKFKKCCGFHTAPVASPAPTTMNAKDALDESRRNLDAQLAKYAPTVSVAEIESKITEAQAASSKANPMAVIEAIFSDDNLSLGNKRHADRLFRAFMSLWNCLAQNQQEQEATPSAP